MHMEKCKALICFQGVQRGKGETVWEAGGWDRVGRDGGLEAATV